MALAKYYEDILERLDEDRRRIFGKLRSSKFRRASDENSSLADHIEKHLVEAEKLFNELLEILTNPDHQGPLNLLSLKAEQARNENLESELGKARELTESSRAVAARMKSEREEYRKENEELKAKSQKLKAEIKSLKHEIKNLKRK